MPGDDRFTCTLCGERFDERDALVTHGLEEHQDYDLDEHQTRAE